MKIIELILKNVKEAMSKFVVSFYGSIVLFILIALQVIFDFTEDTIMLVTFSVGFAVIVSVMLQIMSIKYGYSKKAGTVQRIIAAVTAVPCYFLIGDIFESDYIFMGYLGLILCFLLISLYMMFDAENKDLVFPQIIKSGFFTVIVASLFFGGISLCILAFDFLVVSLTDFDKWIIITALLAYIIICYNLFIAMLPEKTDKITLPKIFKVLVLYVGFPIYTLLLAVLYAYLVKILITMEMPQNQINIFVSLASLFFIFFYLTLGSYDNKAVRFFRRFGGWFLFPILASQVVAIYIRVNAYGLTTARWISILMNITALSFIILTLVKQGRYVKHVITGFAILVFISTFGPLNVIDVPVYEQTHRLEKVLVRNNMLSDGQVKPNKDISDEDKKIISSCHSYLIYEEKAPSYINEQDSFYALFGFDKFDDYGNIDAYRLIHLSKNNSYDTLDISGYSYYYYVDQISSQEFEIEINETIYDVTEWIMNIKEGTDKSDMVFDVTNDIRVYLTYVYYEMDNEGILRYFGAQGFALKK